MALKMVKGSIDRMFDKNLQDLVRGIRNHKEDEVRGTLPPAPARGCHRCPLGPCLGRECWLGKGEAGVRTRKMTLGYGAGGPGWVRARELIREGRAWCSPFRLVCCCDVEIHDMHTDRYMCKHTQVHDYYRGII